MSSSLLSEYTRRLLQDRILEVHPDSVIDDLTCIICERLMIDACQSYCGCQFCRDCLTRYLNRGGSHCPGGKEECLEEPLVLEGNVLSNMALNRKILKVKVRCPNEACEDTARLANLEDHLRVCNHQPTKCPYSMVGCGKGGRSMENVEAHLMKESLRHSQLLVETIENMKNEIKSLREELRLSKEFNEDVATTVATMQEERRKVDQLREIVDGLNIGTNKVVAVDRLSFKVDKFTSRMNDEGFVHSPYFYTHSNGYKLRLGVYPGGYDEGRGSHMSFYISICKGVYDDVLSWPCKYLITVAVVNQRTNEAYETDTFSYNSIFKDSFIKPTNGDNSPIGLTSFISHKDLLSIEGLLVDESVLLQIAFTPPPL